MIYSPREDSFLLEKFVREFDKGKKVLELGCGNRIQMEAALAGGAKEVFGVDIDEQSLEFCRARRLNVKKSDLFSKIRGKFDLIVFNPPYLPADEREEPESACATSGGKTGDEIIVRFLLDCGEHLSKDGKVLLVVSSLTPLVRIKKVMKEKGFVRKVVGKEKFFMERLEVWEMSRTL